jgi:hypothetical protein
VLGREQVRAALGQDAVSIKKVRKIKKEKERSE